MKFKHIYCYIIPYLIINSLLIYVTVFNFLTIVITIIIFVFVYYFQEIHFPIEKKKRTIKFITTFKNIYPLFSETENNSIITTIKNETFKFIFDCDINRYSIKNELIILLDISKLPPDLKTKCKIHFYCELDNEKDWIIIPQQFTWSNSINTLLKNAPKRIESFLPEYYQYIASKKI